MRESLEPSGRRWSIVLAGERASGCNRRSGAGSDEPFPNNIADSLARVRCSSILSTARCNSRVPARPVVVAGCGHHEAWRQIGERTLAWYWCNRVMWMRRPVSSCVDLHRQEKRRRIETLDRQVLPKIITLFERRGDAIDTPKEPEILRTICERMPHLNCSRDLLAHVPGDTAVMEMKGVWWSDWGSLDRIVETLMRLGAGSRALVEHLRAAAMEDRAARMSEGLWVVMKRMKQRLCRSTACMAVSAWVCERTSLARGVLPHSEEALCRKWQQSAGASPLSARWNKVMSPASRPSRARKKLAFLLLGHRVSAIHSRSLA